MKVLIVIAALATLLMPTQGLPRQCAGTLNHRYERSGFLTADWTTKACNAAGGVLISGKKGNEKCCDVTEANHAKFYDSCKRQTSENIKNHTPIPQPC